MGVSENPVGIDTRSVLAEGLTLRGVSRSSREDFQRAVDILIRQSSHSRTVAKFSWLRSKGEFHSRHYQLL